jgi:hypothetical protein
VVLHPLAFITPNPAPHARSPSPKGNVILLEHGYAYIRRLDPLTNSATVITPVDGLKFGEWDHG